MFPLSFCCLCYLVLKFGLQRTVQLCKFSLDLLHLLFQLLVLKGSLTVSHVAGHHCWSFYEYQAEILNIAEKQHVVTISCHLPCIRDVQILIGDVLSISFTVIMIVVGMCVFSLMQPFSAANS